MLTLCLLFRTWAKDRFTSEEAKGLDRMHTDLYKEARLAAEAHRQVHVYTNNCHTGV